MLVLFSYPHALQNAPCLRDQVEKFAALRTQGILSDDEFQDVEQRPLSA